MLNENLVSVIIPVYNVEKYIRDCLDSVVKQTYQWLEIIVVNDGSTDKTGEICNEFAEKYTYLRVIHIAKRGVSAARNIGLDRMSGRWVVFVDGDDYIHPNMIEVLHDAAVKNKGRFVRCGYVQTQLDRALMKWDSAQKTEDIVIRSVPASQEFEAILRNVHKPYVWAAIYDKDIFKDLRFRENYVYEDVLMIAEILASVDIVYHVEGVYSAYRLSEGSITRNIFTGAMLDLCTMMHKRTEITRKEFPALYGLAAGRSWSVTMNVYNKSLAQGNANVAERLLKEVRNTYAPKMIPWKTIITARMPMIYRVLLIGCKISFRGTCKLKRQLVRIMDLKYRITKK